MRIRSRAAVLAVLVALILTVAAPQALGAGSFSDVQAGHIFYQEIMNLAGLNIVVGFPDGTFKPDSSVTRQQFAKMIVLTTDKHTEAVDNQADPTFPDVLPSLGLPYPFDYIEEAAEAGFIKGNAGMFNPGDNITRAQLALIIVRAGGGALADPPAGYQTGFSDLPDFAKAEIAKAKFNGILDGKTSTSFDPYANATRGQACKMLSRLLDKMPKAGKVIGTSATPSADFQAIADRLAAVLALGYNTVNPDAVAKVLMDANAANDPVIIDTREPADYAKGHIPGAVNIPLQKLPQALLDGDARIPMNKEIVTVSYWGDDGDLSILLINAFRILDPAAQKAAIDAKTALPYPKCTTIFQGMVAWSFDRELVPEGTRFDDALAAGITVQKPVEPTVHAGVDQQSYPLFADFETSELVRKIAMRARDYLTSFPTQFDIHVYPSALAAELADGNAADDPQVISVRGAADYAKGHIPGAINIPYQQVANVAAQTKFVETGRPLIAYCYTGHTGGLATMALGILGYDVRNLLYGMNGWSTTAPASGQLKNFDLMRGWDFPVNDGGTDDLTSLGEYAAPAGCVECHSSLTGVFYDREVLNIPAAGAAPPSEGEG
ncbi:MAG: S-layer homology domain-containing protein [Thermoleophilia bacterium]